jgi:DNA polymerase-4
MDEFFAAVEKLDNPGLRGKPILVGGDPKARGVVATASYEARAYGCHSAMAMAKAVRLCPQAVVIHPRLRRYEEAGEQVFEILRQFTPLVEGLSIDEAFLDVAGSERLRGSPRKIAADIKARIRSQTGLTASVGVSFNKFLAKLASDLKKPDGLVVIEPSRVHEVLDPLPVTKIWGVGPAAAGQLERLNIRTIGQLRRADAALLVRTLGAAAAEHYLNLADGRDDRPVVTGGQAKSIGQEETFRVDIDRREKLRAVLLGQVQEVARRLREQHLRARTITLKIRHGDFTTLTRSRTLDEPTHSTDDLWQAAAGTFEEWAAKQFRPLRLLGAHVSNLTGEQGGQLNLFESAANQKHSRLDKTMDDIARKFGAGTISRGKSQQK